MKPYWCVIGQLPATSSGHELNRGGDNEFQSNSHTTNFEVAVERLGCRIVASNRQISQGAVPRDAFPTELLTCEYDLRAISKHYFRVGKGAIIGKLQAANGPGRMNAILEQPFRLH